MSTKFRLSSAQLKELQRGNRVKIALPIPPEEPPDLLAWARASLPEVDPRRIRRATIAQITVAPGGATDGLQGRLGVILHEHMTRDLLTLQVLVCVVDIAQTSDPKSTYPLRWPKEVIEE